MLQSCVSSLGPLWKKKEIYEFNLINFLDKDVEFTKAFCRGRLPLQNALRNIIFCDKLIEIKNYDIIIDRSELSSLKKIFDIKNFLDKEHYKISEAFLNLLGIVIWLCNLILKMENWKIQDYKI
ncbi:hypothetical protein BpHYR1_029177 [Brachionus plicatilis]|uniref:Uncharacterized protein n=1 Tax=Brachionus plicatilis TaxID=10195 RepID=A0A3M7T4P9_BRAPC|nr:hypothetical protein BpHYR1_029177 [Brachionus plicatilis]